jgi:hypothetical protein
VTKDDSVVQTVEQALQQAKLYSDDQLYNVIQLPSAAITAAAGVLAEIGEPFGAVIVDKDEVTLIIPADDLEDFTRRIPGYLVSPTPYRLITFDVELEPSLVGFMARVSKALADAGVPIFAYAAFTRDHLLVPSQQFDTALETLNALRAQ